MGLQFTAKNGSPFPLGATVEKKGVNFSVFSEHGTGVELLLFEKHNSKKPFQVISLDPIKNRTYHFWHIFVEKIKPGYFYAYRVDGPNNPNEGLRFNRNKVLIDPYSKGVSYSLWKREDALGDKDNLETSLRSAIIDIDDYDWDDDRPLHHPIEKTIVYEMHVGNFTNSPTAKAQHPGTFLGVIEKIPYLKSLGITAVELMPVFDFDTGDPKNVWGYGSSCFFAPESSYCTSPDKASHVRDFRDMVKALHKAGIEVILDIVFGYTSEGNETGPTLCFKGFDNPIYYQLSPENKQYYMNFSGCGNTLNTNHPMVAKFITDCLEYWVDKMHVDGFRFDEASIMSRDETGNILKYPHVLWNIDLSPKLAHTKIFAEPWDAGGAYLVGQFPGYRFVEWNGRYRDDIRKFVRGDLGMVRNVASRLTGSADLYQHTGRLPINSLNFIDSHDGFTLYDLVSYNQKHNEVNGENNTDGINENFSWNCGEEGETHNPEVNHLRMKQIRNFATLLFLSKGIPMFVMGDEVARTQYGNNNAYCQNNRIAWFNWSYNEVHSSLLNFFRHLIAFRKQNNFFTDNDTFNTYDGGDNALRFHGCKLDAPGWDDTSRVLAFTLKNTIHIMINMDDQDLLFEVTPSPRKHWHLKINTAEHGVGIYPSGEEKLLPDLTNFHVERKSIVVLCAK